MSGYFGNYSTLPNPNDLTFCTPEICDITTSFYNYRIDLGANIALLVCFAVTLLAYLILWMRTRQEYFFTFAILLGLVTELIGYAGRIWSYTSQWDESPYVAQLVCLTLAPAFVSAAIYICLGRVVTIYGAGNSRIPARWYTIVFMTSDAVALILQAVGGGIAASALSGLTVDVDVLVMGVDILTAGLAWQVFSLFCFAVLCVEFVFRVRRRRRQLGDEVALSQDELHVQIRASKLFKYFLFALSLSTLLIVWRCSYRVAELNEGFFGPVTFYQGLFIGFEGVLILAAVVILAVFHPAICLGKAMTDPWTRRRDIAVAASQEMRVVQPEHAVEQAGAVEPPKND